MKVNIIVLLIFLLFNCQSKEVNIMNDSSKIKNNLSIAEQLAQNQLIAYNNKNIEEFLKQYSDNVKIYSFPNILKTEGKEEMRKIYSKMFETLPDLHCELVNRIVQNNTVIDQESVTFKANEPKKSAIAIYKIVDDKISEVYFIQ